METFIIYNLNKAEREKDKSKILSLGPFSYALSQITLWTQKKKENIFVDTSMLYRGLKLKKEQLNDIMIKKNENKKYQLKGF